MRTLNQRDYARGGPTPRALEVVDFISRARRKPWWERIDFFYEPRLYEFPPAWRAHGKGIKRSRLNHYGEVVTDISWAPEFSAQETRLLRLSEHIKGVVAALVGFHQMTAGQLACHLGYPPSKIGRLLLPMYRAGLVERGRFVAENWQRPLDNVYRLRVDKPLKRWLAGLDDDDLCAVTLCLAPGAPAYFVRHNLLVSELALRLQETAPVPLQAIYGERFAASARLLPGVSRRQLYGDCAIVRADGLRVVVELLQCQRERDTLEKMTAWGKALSQGPLDELGTVVVFVNAYGAGEAGHVTKATFLRRCQATALSPEALGTSTEGTARARMAIHIASWRDWFPGDRLISTDFASLKVCYCPDGTSWQHTSLLAPPGSVPFRPADPARWHHPALVVADPAREAGVTRPRGVRYYGVPSWAGGPFVSWRPLPAAFREAASAA